MPRLANRHEYALCETQTLRDRRSKLLRRVRYRSGLTAEQAELKAITTELLRRAVTPPEKPEPLGDAGAVGGSGTFDFYNKD